MNLLSSKTHLGHPGNVHVQMPRRSGKEVWDDTVGCERGVPGPEMSSVGVAAWMLSRVQSGKDDGRLRINAD